MKVNKNIFNTIMSKVAYNRHQIIMKKINTEYKEHFNTVQSDGGIITNFNDIKMYNWRTKIVNNSIYNHGLTSTMCLVYSPNKNRINTKEIKRLKDEKRDYFISKRYWYSSGYNNPIGYR